ncbi:death-inducer obliterator 1-like isoform X2 [Cavia porcellus]|uniref:death-inducer obliterator 1-like isoform X2 n=1 Tax=Cavia porcellus TaxID=10141 RepID=UPI002FE23FFE
MDDAGDQSSEDTSEASKPLRKEFRKTWGSRRILAPQRKGAGDKEGNSARQRLCSPSPRHSRRPGRRELAREFLSTVWPPGKDVVVSLEESTEPASCLETPVQSALGGYIESSPRMRRGPVPSSRCVKERPAPSKKARGWAEPCSTSDSADSEVRDGFTLEALQDHLPGKPEPEAAGGRLQGVHSRLRKPLREGHPSYTAEAEAGSAGHSALPRKLDTDTEAAQRAVSQAATDDRAHALEAAMKRGPEDKDPRHLGRPQPEGEGCDPNAMSCVCCQPLSNRVVIFCDRCEEWFLGDCVGVSEARGQPLEKNRDDHLCAACTTLQTQHKGTAEATDDQEPGRRPRGAEDIERRSSGPGTQSACAKQGSQGGSEETSSCSGEKPARTASPVTVAPGAVPCAGPGCSSVAQPGTVYCSNNCILKHAAAAMRLLSVQKGRRLKPKKKSKMKPRELHPPKPSVQAGVTTSSVHKRPPPDEIENPVKKAMITPRGDTMGKEAANKSSMPSRASNHQASAAVPQKTAAPSPLCWSKSPRDPRSTDSAETMTLPGSPVGRHLLKKPHPFVNVTGAKPTIKKSPSGFGGPIPKRPLLSGAPAGCSSKARQGGPVSRPRARDLEMLEAKRRPVVTSGPMASAAPGHLMASGAAWSPPESQICQSTRRCLQKRLRERVCDSGDLIVTESEGGKAALHLEKEMLNVFPGMDPCYRSEHRSVVLHLQGAERQQRSVHAVHVKSAAPLLGGPGGRSKGQTSQHPAHLSALNYKICTDQVPSEDEPGPKKQKISPSAKQEDLKSQPGSSLPDRVSRVSAEGSAVAASESHLGRASGPKPERKYVTGPPGDRGARPSPLKVLPSCPDGVVTAVTVSNRDPRTAVGRSCTIMASAENHLDSTHITEATPGLPKPAVLSVTLPKSILVKPTSSLDLRHLSVPPSPGVSSISESRSPRIGDRTLPSFPLSSIWKGLIHMESIGKFVTKAYPVSGSSVCVSEDLPDTIHIGGRIVPETVWNYVGKLQSSVSKELCLICFQPVTSEEEGAYTSLYYYFSSCGRFGVVANTHRRIKDLYLIPLSAKDPVPPSLWPFAGPGLESPRPNLLLGLVISEKQKHLPEPVELDRIHEKAPLDTPGRYHLPAAPRSKRKPPKSQPSSAAVGTPTALLPLFEAPVWKTLLSLSPGATCSVTTPATAAPAPEAASPVPPRPTDPASPLRFLLQTLFKGSSFLAPPPHDLAGLTPPPQQDGKAKGQAGLSGALLLDPIVQQFGCFISSDTREEEEDDRPYDPEEGYDVERASDTPKWRGVKTMPGAAEQAEVAYDPEDETFLEAARVTVADLPKVMCTDLGSSSQERPGDHRERGSPPAQQGHQEIGEELKSSLARRRRFPQEPRALDQSWGALGPNYASCSRPSRDPQQARPLGESRRPETLAGHCHARNSI